MRTKSCKTACDLASQTLERESAVTTEDLLEVLRTWKFERNRSRQNVIPEGHTWVNSDVFGLVTTRTGHAVASRAATRYPGVMRLLMKWLNDNQEYDFPCTTITINYGFRAKLHRDGNNVGPSLGIALGDFEGGSLLYYPDDDKQTPLDKLPSNHAIKLEIKDKLTLFDGHRGHSVEDFSGERFSLIFFCAAGFQKADESVRSFLRTQCGVSWPTDQSVAYVKSLLPLPRGYHFQYGRAYTTGTGPLDTFVRRPAGEPEKRKQPETANPPSTTQPLEWLTLKRYRAQANGDIRDFAGQS